MLTPVYQQPIEKQRLGVLNCEAMRQIYIM